jgi:hypothetical protein
MTTKRVPTMAQFSENYEICRTKSFEEIANGRLETFLIGRSRRVTVKAADKWLDNLISSQSKNSRPDFSAISTKSKKS